MDRLKARQPAKDCVGSSVSEIARIPPFAAGRSVLPPRFNEERVPPNMRDGGNSKSRPQVAVEKRAAKH